MTPEEKAYLAGFIDGVGSIMLLKFHHNQSPSPCISVASISLELLEWIKTKTGVGSIKPKKNYNPAKHKNSYTYTAKYNDAIKLLEAIVPYLIIKSKKDRTRLILDEYKYLTPRNGRYTEEQFKLKEEFYQRFMAL